MGQLSLSFFPLTSMKLTIVSSSLFALFLKQNIQIGYLININFSLLHWSSVRMEKCFNIIILNLVFKVFSTEFNIWEIKLATEKGATNLGFSVFSTTF